MAYFILPLLQVSSTTPSFQNMYYMLFPFSILLFLLSFDMFLSPSSHSCVWLCMHVCICTCKNSLEYCPFLKQSICYLFWFHLYILFPKNKFIIFSTSVFSFCLCFLFKTFNNLWECMISNVSTIPQSVFPHCHFCGMITLCPTSLFFSIKCVSLCIDFCILQYINLYVKNIDTFTIILV